MILILAHLTTIAVLTAVTCATICVTAAWVALRQSHTKRKE